MITFCNYESLKQLLKCSFSLSFLGIIVGIYVYFFSGAIYSSRFSKCQIDSVVNLYQQWINFICQGSLPS